MRKPTISADVVLEAVFIIVQTGREPRFLTRVSHSFRHGAVKLALCLIVFLFASFVTTISAAQGPGIQPFATLTGGPVDIIDMALIHLFLLSSSESSRENHLSSFQLEAVIQLLTSGKMPSAYLQSPAERSLDRGATRAGCRIRGFWTKRTTTVIRTVRTTRTIFSPVLKA
jgi:hypothetical protein